MAEAIAESPPPRVRSIVRDVVLQSTSASRADGLEILAILVRESGAAGAAYGWSDPLGPDLLVPVHQVRARDGLRWDARLPDTCTVPTDEHDGRTWHLMLRDVEAARLARAEPTLTRAVGWFTGSHGRDLPRAPNSDHGAFSALVEALTAFHDVGFELGLRGELPTFVALFRREARGLPPSARAAAVAVADSLVAPAELADAMLRLADAATAEGAHGTAIAVRVLAYDCAARHGLVWQAVAAARAAAKSFRVATDFSESLRWYDVAGRIAHFLGDTALRAMILDGEGNTHRHRGAYPTARACYERAWALARESGDTSAIGSVAHSMMTVEREAGRRDSAARYAWIALQARTDPDDRANLLLNVGTLLREGGSWSSAADAYRVARETSTDRDVRMMAADALALCAALRGTADYEMWRRVARAESRGAPPFLRAQVGFFRGASLRALGRQRDAARVLRAVARYARTAGLHEWEVRAAELAEKPEATRRPEPREAPAELRRGLSALREAVTGEPHPVA